MTLKDAPYGRRIALTGAPSGLKYKDIEVPHVVRVAEQADGITWVTDGHTTYPICNELRCKIYTEGETL